MSKKLDMACKLLENIEIVKDEEEEHKEKEDEEGKVTKTFLRNVYRLLDEVDEREEYIISVGYIVSRKVEKLKEEKKKQLDNIDVVKFFKELKELTNKIEGEWFVVREELRSILERAIKIYYIKAAKLGEEVCKKP